MTLHLSLESVTQKSLFFLKRYAVDTSVKIGVYLGPMVLLEASQGMSAEQIVESRLKVILVDAIAARVYGTLLVVGRRRFDSHRAGGIRSYVVETGTMLGVYAPIYAGILHSTGASQEQVLTATTALCGVLAITARPFAKYCLDPWRRKFNVVPTDS